VNPFIHRQDHRRHRDVDVLALTGDVAVVERGEHSDRGVQAGIDVGV
jgi:hypothetical protein